MLNNIIPWLAQYGFKVLGAIAIFFIGRIVARKLSDWLGKLLGARKVDSTLVGFARNLSYIVLMAAIIIAALNLIGFDTTSVVAIMGAATLALGFALQDSLSNFAAGVMIILFQPYKVGDMVEINGVTGYVKEVQIFNTIITCLDNKKVIVSNGSAIGDNIINYSANGSVRIDMVFGIGYGDDLLKAKGVLEGILASQPKVLKEPAPSVSVIELGDSSVNFAVRPFVNVDDYWAVHFATHELVKLRFNAEGISIPYPTQDINIAQLGKWQTESTNF
ncbi:MAG: small conductance mechanosensitive channel [Cellvibrionaceae bacterium]|jgi:small conductance mechanosensitive channel